MGHAGKQKQVLDNEHEPWLKGTQLKGPQQPPYHAVHDFTVSHSLVSQGLRPQHQGAHEKTEKDFSKVGQCIPSK